ncbi:MAG: DNA polymerase I, partial [Candidatus Cloacimonetes bacterium]|nr:DNA polymerase I [Candidatus Cloacimonadota bacterium]
VQNNYFDTILASYLTNPNMRHKLDIIAREEFNYKMIPIEDMIGKGKEAITFDKVMVSQATIYAAEDAWIAFRLYHLYQERLESMGLKPLFEEVENPLAIVLADMERRGVHIDENALSKVGEKVSLRLYELTDQIYEAAGKRFNINSTQQLAQILFTEMGIKPIKKTKTGFSTNNAVLEQLAEKVPIARLLIEYRMLSKLNNGYIISLPKLIDPETGRIHSSFNQTGTATGRFSSANPNLQNIPIRSKIGKEIRRVFTAPDDNTVILAADYSQIELRVMAILSKDDKLIEAFRSGKDIHTETAAQIFDIAPEDVTKAQRGKAKVINFGIMYGMGAVRLSRELEISRKEATKFIEQYFEKFPTIRDFLEKQVAAATENGYVETIFRRKRFLPQLSQSNQRFASGAERVAVNSPIQGSAADIIKLAMVRISIRIKDNPAIRMLIQVHDELVFEVDKSAVNEAKSLIVTEMENALPAEFRDIVPLKVECGVATNWLDAH